MIQLIENVINVMVLNLGERSDSKGFSQPRAYGECRKQRRDEFILELFRVIENKLA